MGRRRKKIKWYNHFKRSLSYKKTTVYTYWSYYSTPRNFQIKTWKAIVPCSLPCKSQIGNRDLSRDESIKELWYILQMAVLLSNKRNNTLQHSEISTGVLLTYAWKDYFVFVLLSRFISRMRLWQIVHFKLLQ